MIATLTKTPSRIIITTILISSMVAAAFYLKHLHHNAEPAETMDKLLKNAEDHDLKMADGNSNKLWQKVIIRSGDTLQGIFIAQHIKLNDLWQLVKLKNPEITRLHPGRTVDFLRDDQHHLLAMRIPIAPDKVLLVSKTNGRFTEKSIQLPAKADMRFSSGVIRSSLASATKNAGLTEKMYTQLTKIFNTRVNFARDLHRGDQFALLYRTYSINGKKLDRNEIVAAKLITQKQNYYAIQFSYPTHQNGYFTPKGYSFEPRFLDYPLHFRRISSRFTYNRLDPVVHAMRPHLGVDFAAKSGTPVYAIGDGRVTFLGHIHGYGNAIKVRFDQQYSALYAHMNRFSPNVKLHREVHKGDIIGYVGSTGWATGPHLHFSFYENNKPKDWLALERPTGQSVPKRYQGQFRKTADRLLAQLEIRNATSLAANGSASARNVP